MHLRKELASLFSLSSLQVEFHFPPAFKAFPVPAGTSLTPSGSSHGAHSPAQDHLDGSCLDFLAYQHFYCTEEPKAGHTLPDAV